MGEGLNTTNKTIGWATLVLILTGVSACSRAPQAADAETTRTSVNVVRETIDLSPEARPRIAIGKEATPTAVQAWHVSALLLDEKDLDAARRRAADALKEGRLYENAEAAIPLYLAILKIAPDDRQARTGLVRALSQLVKLGTAALDRSTAGDGDEAALAQATVIASVVQASNWEDEAASDYLERVQRTTSLVRTMQTAEQMLRKGRVNDAVGLFHEVLALDPKNVRAVQGMAAAESAMIRHAELAATNSNFEAAERWLRSAERVREDGVATVADARVRLETIRTIQVVALRDEALRSLAQPTGLREAEQRLTEVERIARPDDPILEQLRERIYLATYYGMFHPGQVFTDALQDGSRGPQMVVVPHGAFQMGSRDNELGARDVEKPQHLVRFDRGFAMALTEVSVAEFRRFVEAKEFRPRATRRGNSVVYDERSGNFVRRSGVDWQSDYAGNPAGPNDPVIHVSVRDAEAYAAWLSEQTGRNYRLPSESEFEYALRAGGSGRYPWGNAGVPPDGSGNFTGGNDVSPSGRSWNHAFVGYGDGYWGPAPVGSFKPNAWGLHDLAGNVSEWVSDCWHSSYRHAPSDGASWFNPGCRSRVVRGGFWAGSPAQTRSAWRLAVDSDMTNAYIGFRVVRGI
ncbi:MAG: formylglycine-generating enzyme family protein [Xanthomonadaceae bacterium]|nr:formylglycine-generating enzyme family protein [Xanthomonadaceae bacterium]